MPTIAHPFDPTIDPVTNTNPDVSFVVVPASQTTMRGIPTPPYQIILLDSSGAPTQAPTGGQSFLLSDGGHGGIFAPPSEVTIPAGSATVNFTYSNAMPGSYLLGIAPLGGALGSLPPQTVTAVVTTPSGGGSGGGTSTMTTGMINPSGKIFGEGYLWGSNQYWDDTPFATIQDLTIKDDEATSELMGPEQLTAIAVGAKERKVTLEASYATFKLEQLLLARAGSISTLAAVTAPTAAPTLTAAAGTTNYTAGYIAVGYTWMTPYGDTVVSPLATVQVTSTQQVTVSSLASALATAGGASVNYFMSSQSYTTSAAALAAPIYYAGNTAGGATILPNYPTLPARTPPPLSQISTPRRVLNFGVSDQPSTCKMHFQTSLGGLDLEIIAYNCFMPSVEIPIKNREWTVEKLGINVYGDATQPGEPIWQVITV